MAFEDAATYRFNPFDLTKVWPHADYPLVKLGKMTLNRNPTDHHSEMEQFAVEPSNWSRESDRVPTKCSWVECSPSP